MNEIKKEGPKLKPRWVSWIMEECRPSNLGPTSAAYSLAFLIGTVSMFTLFVVILIGDVALNWHIATFITPLVVPTIIVFFWHQAAKLYLRRRWKKITGHRYVDMENAKKTLYSIAAREMRLKVDEGFHAARYIALTLNNYSEELRYERFARKPWWEEDWWQTSGL